MKNDILLVEIKRVNELITGKKIISEQWVSKVVSGVIRFVDDASKKGWKVGSSIENEIAALSKATSDEEAVKILAKISNSSKEFQDIILPEVMKSLSKEVKDEVLKITNLAKKELDFGKNIDEVNRLVDKEVSKIKSDFEGVNEILKKQIKDDLSTYKPNPKPNPDVVDVTLREKMEKAFSEWDKLAAGKLTAKDRALLTDHFWFRGLRARINQVYNQFFKKEEKSLKRIVELSKEAQEDILNATKRQTLYKAIDMEIENLKLSEDFVKEGALKIFQEELTKKVNYTTANQIATNVRNAQSLSDDYPTYLKYLLDETYIGKMRQLPRYPKGHAKEGKIDWGKAISNSLHRTAMTLTLGNPRKLNEIFNEFITSYGKSFGKGLLYYYGWMWGVRRTVFPVILGLVDELYYGWTRETGSEDYGNFLQTWGHFIKERILETFQVYNKTFDEASGMDKYELSVWKSIIDSVWPFEWLWDDLINFADWHNEGGAKRAWKRFSDAQKNRVETSEAYKRALELQQKADSISRASGEKIDSLSERIKSLDSTLGNFQINPETDKIFEEFKEYLRTKYPTRTFDNPIHIGGNKYKPSDDSPVIFEYENGKFIAK
jgi:hypothetical protein